MSPSLLGAWAFLMVAPPPVAASFAQVAPGVIDGAPVFRRTPDRYRAVVLLHGLRPHPFRESSVTLADRSIWEEPSSPLVRRLGQESDVFAFSYGQNVSVGDVSAAPELAAGLRRLRALGYEQVVLVGYSAGALIAREFVEDDADAGQMLSCALRSAGAETQTSRSVSEGFGSLAEWIPDALLSDINMPGEDGYSFIERLRSIPQPEIATIPAIALTAMARPEDEDRALSSGFQMHIPKPIDIEELTKCISGLVRDYP